MANDYLQAVQRLSQAATHHGTTYGSEFCGKVEDAALPLLSWIGYAQGHLVTGTADELIRGAHSAVIETASCLALGLVRPALFSIRAQVDMCLAWLYFKDHRIEWNHVQNFGEGYKMKRDISRYLDEYYPRFTARINLMNRRKTRQENDPYRLLSAHVHSQSIPTIPSISTLESVVCSLETCRECIVIQQYVAEYLGDIFVSCFAEQWLSLPSLITEAVSSRLQSLELKDLVS